MNPKSSKSRANSKVETPKNMASRRRDICLGSKSKIKVRAVQRIFPNFNIVAYDVESGVNPQPVGKEETETGAKNRAMRALQAHPNENTVLLAIGIENGMWKKDKKNNFVDGAAIFILTADKAMRTEVIWTETIDIPNDFEKGPNGEWSILKDPHIVITNGNKSREDFLAEALEHWKMKE